MVEKEIVAAGLVLMKAGLVTMEALGVSKVEALGVVRVTMTLVKAGLEGKMEEDLGQTVATMVVKVLAGKNLVERVALARGAVIVLELTEALAERMVASAVGRVGGGGEGPPIDGGRDFGCAAGTRSRRLHSGGGMV